MSKSELIQYLYDEINRQNTWYMWTVGILVTVVVAFAGILGYFQWKLSTKQIENLKAEIEENLMKKYHFDEIIQIDYLQIQTDAVIDYLFKNLEDQMKDEFILQDIARYAFRLESLVVSTTSRTNIGKYEFYSLVNAIFAYVESANKVVNKCNKISQSDSKSFAKDIDMIIDTVSRDTFKKNDEQQELITRHVKILEKLKLNIESHTE